MSKNIKFTTDLSLFKPENHKGVRWLNNEDYHYMNDFWNISLDTWNEAKEKDVTYCAIIEEGKIISVAAVWKYSEDKWEVAAVNTREGFENRGFGKKVVSFVTEYILSCNKIPTLTTGEKNTVMQKVAEKVGFITLQE